MEHASARRKPASKLKKALRALFVALAISAGFAVYLVSDFYAFHILGIFVPLTMLTSSLTALTLLPALVLLLRPRFIMGPPGTARIPVATVRADSRSPLAARQPSGS